MIEVEVKLTLSQAINTMRALQTFVEAQDTRDPVLEGAYDCLRRACLPVVTANPDEAAAIQRELNMHLRFKRGEI